MSSAESETSTVNTDDLSEPKDKPKIIRVLTVVAYTLSVSMAAILLSIYYVFMWDGHPTLARKAGPVPSPMRVENYETSRINRSALLEKSSRPIIELDGGVQRFRGDVETKEKIEYPYEPTAIPVMEAFTTPSPDTSSEIPAIDDVEPLDEEEDSEWPKFSANLTEKIVKMSKRSILFRKIMSATLG